MRCILGLNKCRRAAFTLVELLVVIAIIALLLSIMMPALQKAREQAKTVVCKSNMKNLFLAWRTYICQYDGKLPPATTEAIGASYWDVRPWPFLLKDSLGESMKDVLAYSGFKLTGIFRCPSFKYAEGLNVPWYVCYGMNKFAVGGFDFGTFRGYRKEPQIVSPSTQLLFAESYVPYLPGYGIMMVSGLGRGNECSFEYVNFRHNNYANVTYPDGHVVSKKESDIKPDEYPGWLYKSPWGWPTK